MSTHLGLPATSRHGVPRSSASVPLAAAGSREASATARHRRALPESGAGSLGACTLQDARVGLRIPGGAGGGRPPPPSGSTLCRPSTRVRRSTAPPSSSATTLASTKSVFHALRHGRQRQACAQTACITRAAARPSWRATPARSVCAIRGLLRLSSSYEPWCAAL
jgi:hypothetical protein